MTNATVSEAPDKASQAAQAAEEVATTAKEQIVTVAQTGQEEARSVAGDASSQARRLLSESSSELRQQADSQTVRVAEGLRQISGQLQQMAGAVEDTDSPVVSLVGHAADMTDRLAGRLEHGGIDSVVDDTRRLARNRPGMFLAGALGAGFLVGRMLKGASSASGPSEQDSGRQGSRSASGTDIAAAVPQGLEASYTDQGTATGYQDPAAEGQLNGGLPSSPAAEVRSYGREA
jgi:hypothetical protein